MQQYWIWLSTRPGLSPRAAFLTACHFSSAQAAYFAGAAEYATIDGVDRWEGLLDKSLDQANQVAARCYDQGIGIVTWQDAAYPERLRTLPDPPLVLYYKGRLPDFNGPLVGVVGTRRASAYGLGHARRFGYGLCRCGAGVVSGGARGIDTQALLGALTGGGPAIAVLGCGVDVVYPRENRRLFEDVAAYGCLLSEFLPGTPPEGWHFPVRNRIISGLSMGILVVEAPEKSGALITADLALEQGRDVFVLPANVDQSTSSGNLRLLRDGAIPVGDPWELLEEYAGQYPLRLTHQEEDTTAGQVVEEEALPQKKARKPQMPPAKKVCGKEDAPPTVDLSGVLDTFTPDERALALLLQEGPAHIDEIADRLQMAAGQALASLTLLEVKGYVQRLSAGMYALRQAETK